VEGSVVVDVQPGTADSESMTNGSVSLRARPSHALEWTNACAKREVEQHWSFTIRWSTDHFRPANVAVVVSFPARFS